MTAHRQAEWKPSDLSAEFYRDDYKLKVDYLSGQFQRMWTRFNLFLTLEVGLVGFLITKDTGALGAFAGGVAIVEMVISAIWVVVGLQDRCLVRIYRVHVRDAASMLATLGIVRPGYVHAGEVTDTIESIRADPTEGKSRLDRLERRYYFRVTRLAYLFPLVALVLWTITAVTVWGIVHR